MNHPASRSSYPIEAQVQAWTRIDMLLAIYDRTILTVQALNDAKQKGLNSLFSEKFLETQKCLLALHAGLKPEDSDVAFNIARLLHFVSNQIDLGQFDVSIEILEAIRNGFEAIREEAAILEKEGKIPSLETSQNFTTIA